MQMIRMIRNIGIRLALDITDFGAEIAYNAEPFSTIEYIGLKMDAFGHRLFRFCYEGSKQEIEDALDYTEEEWPSEHMTKRQIQARINAPDDSWYVQGSEPIIISEEV